MVNNWWSTCRATELLCSDLADGNTPQKGGIEKERPRSPLSILFPPAGSVMVVNPHWSGPAKTSAADEIRKQTSLRTNAA